MYSVDYFSNPENTSRAKQAKANKQAMNFKQTKDFKFREPSPDKGFYSAPPSNFSRAKSSYRSSYPPSNRETQDYYAATDEFSVDAGPLSPGTGAHAPLNGSARPRRSSLRQPGQPRRSNSTPPKRVRFSVDETIFEPFDAHDAQTIDQIISLLHHPSRAMVSPSIPAQSAYSVSVRRTDAAHEYPMPTQPLRNAVSGTNFMRAQTLDYYAQSPDSRPLPARVPSIEPPRGRQSSRSQHHSEAHCQFRSDGQSPVRARSRSEAHDELRSEVQSPLQSGAHYKRNSSSQHETHAQRRDFSPAEPHSRARGCTVPAPSSRSSLESDETLINGEVKWAPASVMLDKQQAHGHSMVDEDKPVAHASNDAKALRRSAAQRLPAVPRRHKLLQNIVHMFD